MFLMKMLGHNKKYLWISSAVRPYVSVLIRLFEYGVPTNRETLQSQIEGNTRRQTP